MAAESAERSGIWANNNMSSNELGMLIGRESRSTDQGCI
jgi:hypothetical protein